MAATYPIDFKNPDFREILRDRMERLKWLRANPGRLHTIRAYYKDHIADFISDWALTYNPQVMNDDRNPVMPFILMPRQVELVDWILDRWRGAEPGILVKSREIGASWVAFAVACTLCIFHKNMTIGMGSATKEKVDSTNDTNTLFAKGRAFMEYLPEEFRAGWTHGKHDPLAKMLFPQTNSRVIGDWGDDMGRGGRSAIFFVDESAHLEHPAAVDAALSANTRTRIDMSSVKGTANSFAERATNGHIKRFDFTWRDDLRKTSDRGVLDTAWEDLERPRHDPMVWKQEYECDMSAGVEGLIIPPEHVRAAVDAHILLGWKITGMKLAGLDIADRGKDKNAIAIRHGVLIRYVEQWSGQDSDLYETAERAFKLCDEHGMPEFSYDGDGMGVSMRGDARKINEARAERRQRKVRATMYRGSASPVDPEAIAPGTDRTNEDYYKNLKAQAWFSARWRFRNTHVLVERFRGRGDPTIPEPRVEDCISLASGYSDLGRLVTELSQAQYKQDSAGRMLVDKMPEGALSPNLADAVVIAMAPRIGRLVITEQTLQQTSSQGQRAAPGNPGGFRFPQS